jgi:hypothetical protein
MARNDVRHALTQAGRATGQGAPEAAYLVRVATGHFFEAELALRHWRTVEEVRSFIESLPDDAKEALKRASSAIQEMGPRVLQHSRDRTFHYPYPTGRYRAEHELEQALTDLSAEEVTMVVEAGRGFIRLHFADQVALALALNKYDLDNIKAQLEIARDGAIGLVNFATRAWEGYMSSRGLEVGVPAPSD